MIKNLFLFFGLIGLVTFWAQSLRAQFGSIDMQGATAPVVIELFTSQSCSSCPPADKLLGELSQNPNIITLGFHVTYWDHLNWKDTLGREFATQRQNNYSAFRRADRVYTPQMVVNGNEEFVGSNPGKLSAALKTAKPIKTITIDKIADNVIKLNLPSMKGDGNLNYTLRVFGVKSNSHVQIQRGENRGKDVIYHNAVLSEQNLGAWMGAAEEKIVSIPPKTDIDHLVILAQIGGFGPIVAAGKINL